MDSLFQTKHRRIVIWILLSFTLFSLLITSLVFFVQRSQRLTDFELQLHIAFSPEGLWAISQLGHDVLLYGNATSSVLAQQTEAYRKKLQLRNDLLYSRFDVVSKIIAKGSTVNANYSEEIISEYKKLKSMYDAADKLTQRYLDTKNTQLLHDIIGITEDMRPFASRLSAQINQYLRSEKATVQKLVLSNMREYQTLLMAAFLMFFGFSCIALLMYIKVDRVNLKIHKTSLELKKASQAKSQFLSSMSHELRTPLNAILGFSDILFKQYFGPPGEGKYREYAKDIHDSGQHLLELVDDLLDISSIEAGKKSLEKEMLSIKEIVDDCGRIIDEKIQSKNIDYSAEVMNSLSMFYADKRASKQILLNLLWNAVKFTPEGGKIAISVKANRQNMQFTITDTGRGIPANQISNITDPFTRSEINPHISDAGWGLGLSITKSLVELHDGELNIASEVGKGTTVTVTFPFQESIIN